MTKLIVVIVAAGVVGMIAYGWSHYADGTTAPGEIATATVTRGSISTVVACTGRVVANLDVEIKCKASGEITSLPFDISDPVNKDDLLLQVDPIDEKRMVRQAEAALAASNAKLQTARTSLSVARRDLETERLRARANLKSAEVHARDARAKAQRMKELLAKKLASPEDCETAETTAAQLEVELELARIRLQELETQEEALDLKIQEVELAKAQVLSDELNLGIREKSLKDTTVVSPIAGVVSSREVQIGQIISSGISNVGGGTTTMVVSDLSRMFVLASVDESDIGEVKVGQAATITADAFSGKSFEGRVVRIATQGVNLSNVVTFEVKIEVTSEEKALLKPEMTANVAIITVQKENVLIVPAEAVIRRTGEYFAEIAGGPAKEERKVQVGLRDTEKVEILSGLAEGDRIVVHKETTDSRWNAKKDMGPPPPPMMPPPGGRGRR